MKGTERSCPNHRQLSIKQSTFPFSFGKTIKIPPKTKPLKFPVSLDACCKIKYPGWCIFYVQPYIS